MATGATTRQLKVCTASPSHLQNTFMEEKKSTAKSCRLVDRCNNASTAKSCHLEAILCKGTAVSHTTEMQPSKTRAVHDTKHDVDTLHKRRKWTRSKKTRAVQEMMYDDSMKLIKSSHETDDDLMTKLTTRR
eukprot:702311-Amphidinium_carterae.2